MRTPALAVALFLATGPAAWGQPADAPGPPCRPCAGVRVADPEAAARALEESLPIPDEGRLYVAWEVGLGGGGEAAAGEGAAGEGEFAATVAAAAAAAARVAGAGGTPWLRLAFTAPAPLAEHLDALEAELRRAAELTRGAAPATHFQVLWRPAVAPAESSWLPEYAFLLKRASVAIAGAQGQARVISQPLPAAPVALSAFYANEVAAYLDGVAVEPAPGEALEAAAATLAQLDPGRPLVVDALPFPGDTPSRALARAADAARLGAAVAFFDLPRPAAADLGPLALLAREFAGDLSFDPYSVPTGGAGAWSFVRGEDLGLRLLVEAPAGSDELVLTFPDPQLRRPARIDRATGETLSLFGLRVLPDGIELRVADPEPVTLLRLDRLTAEELEGLAERVTVEDERRMPVEEILRRLQTFEDAQARRLDHYRAVNTTHLRFQATTGSAGTFEVSFEGDFFFRRGAGSDWAWQSVYINGVRWRGKRLPEIPLIQPEKAASMPLAIELSRRYTYRLVGSEAIDGRDCWVVEFRPLGEALGAAERLFRGTVWIDREIYARVRTRAIQLGLTGEVLSNEETVSFAPLDAAGEAAPWTPESYFLPVRTVAQQLFSILNTSTVVEREIVLTEVEINGADFEARRGEVLASEATMVRDTERGLRYLVKEEGSPERVVKEGYDTTKLFLVGGAFYDDALDYPLPLGGLNYLALDFKGSGNQVNVFFAGALLTADLADPNLFGSRFDAGVDVFALAVPLSDTLFRDNREVEAEEVESRPASFDLAVGRPLGSFAKLEFEYDLSYTDFGRTDSTAEEFVLPADHFTHSFELGFRYDRRGFRLNLTGSYNTRSEWEPWGLPGNADFDPDHEDYLRWGAQLSKNFYLRRFRRFSAEIDYFGGADLDRFSKYTFGFFGGTRVHGYQSDRVRAEETWLAHLRYGLEVGQAFRLEGVADAALASDDTAGLENEFLAGLGVVGQFIGPWNTIVQVDLGVPVAGPDDGFVAFLAFLKLFG